jgi:hypothetical protein
MRPISTDLLNRIQKAHQTIYENANPKLKVLISKGFSKELFKVYTIHNDEDLESLDVAVRRMDALGKPNKVYVVYIKDGVAHVKSKNLPYDETLPWDYGFQIGSADEVAIEFDGYWVREGTSGRHNLITGEFPYIFEVNAGTLSVRLWNGTPITLATGVSKISAVRGWVPVNGDSTTDQGLIVSYIKSGAVYYRTYAMQSGGFRAWEVERQIIEFTGTVVDVSTFRTNDFRVGFVVQNADDSVELLITTRNWAGMSFEPINLNVGITDIAIDVTPIAYHEAYDIENITAGVTIPRLYVCPFDASMSVTLVERLSLEADNVVKITFDTDIEIDSAGMLEYMTIVNSVGAPYAIASVSATGNVLTITTSVDMPKAQTMTIAMNQPDSYILGGRITESCLIDYSVVSIESVGLPPNGHAEENLTVGLNLTVDAKQVYYLSAYNGDENIEVGITGITIVVTKVGDNPL